MVSSTAVPATTPVEMLFARLLVEERGTRSYLVTAPRSGQPVELADSLADAARRSGAKARVLIPGGEGGGDLPLNDVEGLSAMIGGYQGFTFVAGRGLLDDPGTLLAVAGVEAVLLLVHEGHTFRHDLIQSTEEVRRAGGRVAGTVLLR